MIIADEDIEDNGGGGNESESNESNEQMDKPEAAMLLDANAIKNIDKAAKLSANGVSDSTIMVVCGLTAQQWSIMQETAEYIKAYKECNASTELLMNAGTRDASVATLEKTALRQTLSNINSNICSPEFVLDALKYATKTRLEEKKQAQERSAQFTAATQIVININDVLARALNTPVQSTNTVIDFKDDSKSVVNGLDTGSLLELALGASNATPAPLEHRNDTRQAPTKMVTKAVSFNIPADVEQAIASDSDILMVRQATGSATGNEQEE